MIASERRLLNRQQRIREIIDSAKRVFKAKGLVDATMLDIAEHSKLSRRTLYLYFSNKDEVSLAVASDTLAKLGDGIEEAARLPIPANERLKKVIGVYLDLNRRDPSSFQVILNLDVNVRAVGERHELVGTCFAGISRIKGLISSLLVEGAADGSIRAVPDPEALAATLIAMVQTTLHFAVTNASMLTGPLGIDPGAFTAEAFDILQSYLPAH